jgi:hypothetical protein
LGEGEILSPSPCPTCGHETLDKRDLICPVCHTQLNADPPDNSAIVTVLVLSSALLLISGSCAAQSFSGRNGDESGYGQMALFESAILILTIVWLAVALSLRSYVPRYRKLTVIRASVGVALGVVACGLAFAHFAMPSFPESEFYKTLMLGLSGIVLFISSMRTLVLR